MPTPIFINEYHLAGTASSIRGVEIAGPPNTSMTGWQVYFYSSTTGGLLGQSTISNLNASGFAWINHYGVSYSATGNIGLALVNASGQVVEFITAVPDASYVTPTTGPANGLRPTNTGTGTETSSTTGSIRRIGTGSVAEDFTWERSTSGFTQSAVNTGQTFVQPDVTAPPAVGQFEVAAQAGGTSVRLWWYSAPTSNPDFTGLRVYRDGVKIADLARTATEYVDTGLTPSTAYSYRLATHDAANNESSITKTVATTAAPDPLPVAAFTWLATEANPLTVLFTETGTYGKTFAWDFGDGETSTTQSPTHTFPASGSYTVVLTASNGTGSDAETQTVTVTVPVPDPDPEPDPDPDEPDPQPEPITGLPADVVAFMGRTGDPGAEALAAEHVPVMAEIVNAYVRGNGPKRLGLGLGEFSFPPDLRAVVITASARLINNPAQVDSESADGYASRGGFTSFSLAEQAILHRYRRRSA